MAHRLSIAQSPDGTLLLRYERWSRADIRWLKALPRARWDPVASTWRVPRSRSAVEAIRRRHPEVSIPPIAHGHTNGAPPHAAAPRPERPRGPDLSARPDDVRPAGPEGRNPGDTLPDGWTATVEAAERFMLLRAFSPRTRKVYRNHLKGFARWARKSPTRVTEVDVRAYLVDLVEHRKLSRSYHSQALSAIRMLFTRVLRRPLVVEAVPQPRRERKLPVVLSRDEMRRVIDAARSPHQRALIMMLYSTGLRVSEVVRVRLDDLDGDRGMIRVRSGKGGKDRYTLLSDRCQAAINDHLRFRSARSPWLFPGARDGRHVTARSVQKTVARIGRQARLEKRLTPHVLRHTFATHLLESGTDIRVIQTLLGHTSTRTTEIYTHVSNTHLARIRNPLDQL